jgi:hypothetical protein
MCGGSGCDFDAKGRTRPCGLGFFRKRGSLASMGSSMGSCRRLAQFPSYILGLGIQHTPLNGLSMVWKVGTESSASPTNYLKSL